ncbi:MAG: TonB-dependent receptor plug domain-containing protein, partial [Bacteroidales bacterium]|nr:TonB-dependent receptor plug domain-containing protein [Bacteroidales bacterium]
MKHYILSLGIAMSTPLAYAGGMGEKIASTGADSIAADTTVTLQEVAVRANFSQERRSPLALTTISPMQMRLHFTAPNYVEVMQGVPGVYATASTGSYGDASLNIRGFKQDNIAIMLNGIPIQGLTSGSMYWSNWMGLSDATYAIQIQKGMGGSMLADCAMGGIVNIITKTSSPTPKAEAAISTTQHGLLKTVLNYSTGNLPGGWAANAMVSYTHGDGFVECSRVNTLSYMLSLSKRLGEKNLLLFNAIGSPETHDQRNTELTSAEVELHGRAYSKNWGYLRGEKYSIARNHYYKPYFTLQHLLEGERFSMKNSLYVAIASGGGRSTVSTDSKNNIISHQTADGHIDFEAVMRENTAQQDADGRNIGQHAMIDYLSGHVQAGAIASGEYKLTDALALQAGVQYQYYDTWSKMKMLDLLGADYLLYYGQRYSLGDYIGARYGRTTHHFSAFAEAKYATDRYSLFAGTTVFNGNYRRHDDVKHAVSPWATGWGVSVKAGALYHFIQPSEGKASLSAYANAAFNSRLPYAGTYLASSDLSITHDVTNEKNLLAEAGLRSNWNGGGIELSAYIASWRNKTLTVNIAKRADEAAEKYQVKGLNALHRGIELSAHQSILSWLSVKAYAMMASWKWKSSGKGISYDSYSGATLKEYTVYCNNLHVGDAPQTQYGAELRAVLPFTSLAGKSHGKADNFYATLSWNANARMWADFEPSSRTKPTDGDAFRLPAYHLVGATVGWNGTLSKKL